MATPLRKLKHLIEAIPLRLLPAVLRILPFDLRVLVGARMIGALIRWAPPLRRRIAQNLTLIMPDLSPARRRRLLRDISRHTGASLIEILNNPQFQQRLPRFHHDPAQLRPLIEAHAAGRPIILVSGHFGQFEAARAILKANGIESGAIFRESANPWFERLYRPRIEAGGRPMFATGPRGMGQMLRHLRRGGAVSLLLDQRQDDGVWLDFMGKPALTSLSAAELALRYNALLVPVYTVSRAGLWKREFDVQFQPPLTGTDPLVLTQTLNDLLAEQVRAHPAQWYWLHRRWSPPRQRGKQPQVPASET